METNKVFVYGSLLQGLHNNRILRESKLLSSTATAAPMRMFSFGSFPGVTPAPVATIKGECWEVSDLVMGRLDMLEGHPHFYRREEIELRDGTTAWMYLLDEKQYPANEYRTLDVTQGNFNWRVSYENN